VWDVAQFLDFLSNFQDSVNPQLNFFNDDLKPDGRERSGKNSLSTQIIMNNSKLYAGNPAYTTSEADLQDMFSAHGTVIEVKMPFDRESGRPRGFAFVTMATPEAAQAAILALNGTAIGERNLTVTEAGPREVGAGRSNGGGFRKYGSDQARPPSYRR
jgi:RNA recognition motif-containing protein